jgi:ubiquinone/menaquinone biosynthesis C-methylase UbiE
VLEELCLKKVQLLTENSMTNDKKRKEFMRDTYYKFWVNTRKKYGIGNYEKDLLKLIYSKNNLNKILEVGIGDGYPFAKALSDKKYKVYGIDISPQHIEMVKKKIPDIESFVGDAENLEFNDSFFDLVYCFRSSWYFPDILKAIDEMIRVSKENAFILIDIQNQNHPIHLKIKKNQMYREENYLQEIFLRFSKNILKILIRPFIYFPTYWSLKEHIIIQKASDPKEIEDHLNRTKNLEYKIYGVNYSMLKESLSELDNSDKANQYDRILFEIELKK